MDIAKFFIISVLTNPVVNAPLPDWDQADAGNSERITTGNGKEGDIELLQELATTIKSTALRSGTNRAELY